MESIANLLEMNVNCIFSLRITVCVRWTPRIGQPDKALNPDLGWPVGSSVDCDEVMKSLGGVSGEGGLRRGEAEYASEQAA